MSPAPKKPFVCYVTDRKSLGVGEGGEGVLGKIRAAAAAGVDWVQIREKDLSGRELLALAREAVAGCGVARVIVNERLDVALAAGTAGVHLGRESLSARDVVGYTALQLIVNIPLVLFLMWFFARTLPYVPPGTF